MLFARYDLDAAASGMTPEALRRGLWTLWRYAEILPIQGRASAPSLGEGGTPLHEAPRLARAFGCDRLLIKDEGSIRPAASRPAGWRWPSPAAGAGRDDGGHPLGRQRGRGDGRLRRAGGLPATSSMPSDAPPAMKAEWPTARRRSSSRA